MDKDGKYHSCDECEWRKPGEWHKCASPACGVWHRPPTDEEEEKHYSDIWDNIEWSETRGKR